MNQVYVYAPRKVVGLSELLDALKAIRLRKFDGLDFWEKSTRLVIPEGSTILCWGGALPELDGINVINATENYLTPYTMFQRLGRAGISCTRCSRIDAFQNPTSFYSAGYTGRMNQPSGGTDLMVQLPKPDYFIVIESFANEIRIHSFNHRAIRSGIKKVREGLQMAPPNFNWTPGCHLAHPTIRTSLTGWDVDYTGFTTTPAMRDLAHRTAANLGLTFAAVDLGQLNNGTFKVIGVNPSPLVEGATLNSYVRSIKRLIEKTEEEA